MESKDLYWLAGYLEGEGSFMAGPPSEPARKRISFSTTDADVATKVGELMGCTVSYNDRWPDNPRWNGYWSGMIRGQRAVALMQELRPLMGERRRLQIDTALL
jgi:hypothetical protein